MCKLGVTFFVLCVVIFRINGQSVAPPVPVVPPDIGVLPVPVVPIVPQPSRTKPGGSAWPGKYGYSNSRAVLGDWLLRGCWGENAQVSCENSKGTNVEFEGYDGWYNNIARPDSGAIDTPLLRRWPAAYEDGTYLPSGSKRPNPLTLSEELLAGPIGSQSRTGKNALLVFFGQQVVEEILDAQRAACPPEYFNIPIPENHKYRNKPGHTEMPILRTRYDQRTGFSPNNPRQQLNEISPYIDGNLMYGITKQWADQLRTYSNGTVDPDGLLAYSHDGLFPEYNTQRLPLANPPPPFHHAQFVKDHEIAKVSRFFKLGNPRGNENTFLLTFGILWFRWHNYLARRFRHHHPDWPSEKVFNEARKWVIATHQHILLDEWLPTWVTAKLPPYKEYDPSINPQIDQFFQSAAFRFGHTLVTPGVYLRDYGRNGCDYSFPSWNRTAVRTCNAFWRPQDAIKTRITESATELIDIDRVLMGMSVQLCEEEDHKIVEDLRGNVFGPLEFPRRDLMAINVQRGRDHGLPDFNTARKAYGLRRVTDVSHFQYVHKNITDKLMALYNNSFDDIDPWIGGILETGDGPGELFQTVILDQFRRIRDGDRFWFENTNNGLFSDAEVARIRELRLYDIIMAVTKLDDNDIPRVVFNVPVRTTQDIAPNCVTRLLNSTCRVRLSGTTTDTFPCFHLPQLNKENLNEECVEGYSFDYFNGSETSYILTYVGIGTFIIATIGGIMFLAKFKQQEALEKQVKINDQIRSSFKHEKQIDHPVYAVKEWSGPKMLLKPVVVVLNSTSKQIYVMSHKGDLLRALDLSYEKCKITIYVVNDEPYAILRTAQNYDLVLQFESNYLRQNFHTALERFIDEIRVERENINNFNLKAVLKVAITREHRQRQLEMFFRVVFAQAFKITHSNEEILKVDANMAREVVYTELTLNEFADALSMKPQAEFVVRMFHLIDRDKNGFVSFREFVDLLIIFAAGDESKKAKLLFDMYDINATGVLTTMEFTNMIRSFLETVEGNIEPSALKKTITNMIQSAGLQNKANLTFEDFKNIIGGDIKKLNQANLGFKGAPDSKSNFIDNARDTIENIYESPSDIQERLKGVGAFKATSKMVDKDQDNSMMPTVHTAPGKHVAIFRFFEQHSKEIFWTTLYTLVLWAIFAERAYFYSVEAEHSGLRRIAGYGVTVTRGAASAMMFTYSSLLITMCRNTITFLRDTVIGTYLPLDSFIELHKYIAYWALFFTVMHIVGHAFNFYHIATQPADDLTCLFRNYFHATHEFPKFHYWCWQTMTGVTGVLLTLMAILIYLFAQSFVRRHLYNWFWYVHNLYPIFYILMVLHGTGRLIQEPYFHYFFLGPVIFYTLDMIVSVSRKKVEIPVVHAEILPSDVTMLEFKRPESFEYKSGQWVRISCLELNSNEYHPFTLTSSPDETNLTIHIRSVGPWTRNIRKLYDNSIVSDKPLPKIHLDGPFGDGHQDWYRFDVAVLVGGGIGVTPFASILKDIVVRANLKHKTQCNKVYFIWVSRTQKQFEWLVDILRDLEKLDQNQIVSSHIFITQFYQKFDLRTVLLYICERHYQKLSDKSLFTNLKAVTHFGRPNFKSFFKSLQALHSDARNVGVFSCGPPPMTASIEQACVAINKITVDGPTFKHHFKNF